MEKIIGSNLIDDDGKACSNDKIERILKSLARNESTTVSISRIAKDIEDVDSTAISPDTVARYIEQMSRMFLFNDQLPFDPNVRSSLRVGAKKRHFCDPSLACAALNLNEKKLFNDMNTFGFLFEALVERDLSIYAQSIGAKLYHYRNYRGDEIGAVVELEDGSWLAFEIKLGANRIEEGADNLIKVCNSIAKNNGKGPISKGVICGLCNAACKRPDGVFVIPFTALRD